MAGLAWRVFIAAALALAMIPATAYAIDFYEIQIYPVETEKPGHLTLELHSNSVTTATGSQAHDALHPYQIHETIEATYGVLKWLEVGQYLCTAKLDNGSYEYAGARTKIHFAVPQTEKWPVQFGANVELDYMRRAAEDNPLSLELRPIAETRAGDFQFIGDFVFSNPMSGAGAHRGFQFAPSGEVLFDRWQAVVPAIEYYGDLGPMEHVPSVQRQEQFIVPSVNLNFIEGLEFNLGVGVGMTRTSNGLFVKSIVGWTF